MNGRNWIVLNQSLQDSQRQSKQRGLLHHHLGRNNKLMEVCIVANVHSYNVRPLFNMPQECLYLYGSLQK